MNTELRTSDAEIRPSWRSSQEQRAVKKKLNVVLFSGGSGTHSITEAFRKHPQISLTILINAYDDGHSTGRLRKFIPGMLGPSDVRKNINRLMGRSDKCDKALRSLSDYRLPVGISFESASAVLHSLAVQDCAALVPQLRSQFELLSLRQARSFSQFCRSFEDYVLQQEILGNRFDFTDCSVGNILFAGCYLQQGRDFNKTIETFSRFHEVEISVLNITRGENLFLIAVKEDGTVLRREADIVSTQNTSKIGEIILVQEDVYRTYIENDTNLTARGLKEIIQGTQFPYINEAAERAIREADVIIYGPGTQHSSLFPSYLTRGVAEAIVENKNADKIFIANIRRDNDIQRDDANDLAMKFLTALRRNREVPLDWKDVVTHFFFQKQDNPVDAVSSYVPFDQTNFRFPLATVKLRDWELQDGRHEGGYVLEELQQIVQSRIEISMQPFHHLVSIIVPALNEERAVHETLQHLTALDFSPFDLGKEIILVDGGSTDRTLELARAVRGVKAFRFSACRGRGEAIKFGMAKARGDIIVTFPADNEYRAQDIYSIVSSVVHQGYHVVFGTRAIKCGELNQRLKIIYGKAGVLYFLSKYGGMLLSTLTLFLYNRYISDTLTSLKGYDARVLRSMELKSNGIDLDMELVAKLSRQHHYILEVPVEYRPRTRAEGKKTTVLEGLRAIRSLIHFRFAD